MKKIFLSNGDFTLVSNEDYIFLVGYNWWITCNGGYAKGSVEGKDQTLHRIVAKRMGIDLSNQIDHTNGNKLDNRRENLRSATPSQNVANSDSYKNNKSGYKGVSKRKNKWRAQIQKVGIQYHLGLFDTPEEASNAYVKAAEQLHGEFAHEQHS